MTRHATLPLTPKGVLMTQFSESDTMVAIQKGVGQLTQWVPQLPIHSNSKQPTSGTYKLVKVQAKYKDGIVPARDNDYYNPSQLFPSTGPLNLAPMASATVDPRGQFNGS